MKRTSRSLVAVVIAVAILYQLFVSLDREASVVNFFSFFTILSNVAAASVMTYQAVRASDASPSLRGAIALYMTITGLIHAVLLAPITADVGLTEPWVDFVLHIAAPVAVVADWFIYQPSERVSIRSVAAWLLFPTVYLGYSLIRGPLVDWYPYPFLDPVESGGYGGVAVYSVAILVAFVWVAGILRRFPGVKRAPS